MVLNIIVNKIDYSPSKLVKIAKIMIKKADLFQDLGEEREYRATFTGSNISKFSQCVRAIKSIKIDY